MKKIFIYINKMFMSDFYIIKRKHKNKKQLLYYWIINDGIKKLL